MYHGGCPPHHDATSWGTVHANGKLVTCLWQDSSVSFEGFLEVKNTDIILVPTWSNIKSTMIFQDFPLALFCFIILFGNMSFGGVCESCQRDLGDVGPAQDEWQDPEAHDTAFLLTFFECFEKGDIIEELCYRHHWHEKYENKEVNALHESE